MENEELDIDDITIEAYNKIDALIDLLVKKKIITKEEYDEAFDALLEELEDQENEN